MKRYTENDSLWVRLQKEERPIILYGTGNGADKILDVCTRFSIPVEGVFASSDFVRNRTFREMPVQSIDMIREKYGDKEVDAANAAVLNATPEQYSEWTQLGEEIQQRIEAAVQAQLAPDSEAGRAVYELHKRWIHLSTGKYDVNMHCGIAAMYVCDERFTAYYDKNLPGCAQFLKDAVNAWAK